MSTLHKIRGTQTVVYDPRPHKNRDRPARSPRPPCSLTETALLAHRDRPARSPRPPCSLTETALLAHRDRPARSPRPPCSLTETALLAHRDRPARSPRPPCSLTETALLAHRDRPARSNHFRNFWINAQVKIELLTGYSSMICTTRVRTDSQNVLCIFIFYSSTFEFIL